MSPFSFSAGIVLCAIGAGSFAAVASAEPLMLYNVLKPKSVNFGTQAQRPPEREADPLFPFQWPLLNRGNLFLPGPYTRGIDLNVVPVYRQGITGKGVRVMIVDGGLDARHEDLAANVDRSMLHSFTNTNDASATDVGSDDGVSHGTAMAGIVAAVARNGVGGRGVAPGATLGAAQLLAGGERPDERALMQTYGGAPFSRNTDVFSASYEMFIGLPEFHEFESDSEVRALAQLPGLRGGRGAVVVKPSGNEFDGMGDVRCPRAKYVGLTCGHAAFSVARLLPQTIVVSSVNATGKRSSFSNTGANVLVAGLGGDDAPTPAGSAPLRWITTDISGCERGVVAHTPTVEVEHLTDFETPGTLLFGALNARCNYLSISSGTSSAVPSVAGVIALMLEANPALTWRDIRVILARTSRRVDAQSAPLSVLLADRSAYVAEPGWTRNGAGLWFHNAYGYGLVDAQRAVDVARNWPRHLSGPMPSTEWVGLARLQATDPARRVAIPRGKAAGASDTIRVPQSGLVEFVQVRVALDKVNFSDLAIELTSPSGTRSVLLTPYTMLDTPELSGEVVFASNAFMSERMDGAWTLRVVNTGFANPLDPNDAAAQPSLLGWAIRVMGDA
ncbi:S8 family serine peptidase [Pararobbsia silviterrae]|uniref:P/Homo B domain-containing protein n=1 Tax=Pararobbsia silviterrae TaxID=1792498 RepID=A0A494XIW8_9BURK|nr:S8 family serine peptidase [Pararobbsia silviterrae]RKP48586.1 hypothetical protein D7S86_21510 [Pararobbsia silviterrae]